MGISIVRFQQPDQDNQWGIVVGKGDQGEIAILPQAYTSHRELMDTWSNNPDKFDLSNLPRIGLNETYLVSPITSDVQIFCQGLNYATHQAEGGVKAGKGKNLIFSKPPSSICGPQDTIVRPIGCELLDYEIELALVLKRDLPPDTLVTTDNLLEYIGGFTLANDVSARDFMFGAPMLQWFKGKGQRTFCPTGPILYLLDTSEADLLSNLEMTLTLNNEIRQQATTDQMIFKPDESLTELAAFTDVNKGDMLLTGTPGGVTLNANLKVAMAILLNFTNDEKRQAKLVNTQRSVRYLQPGDKLTLCLKSKDGTRDFGAQENEVRNAS